jgi:hypothetical protein
MMFYFQSGQLGHSTNTIILKSNEHKSYAWVFGVICTFQSSQFFDRLSMHFGVVDHIRASALTTANLRPPSWNRITDSTHAPPVGNGIGEPQSLVLDEQTYAKLYAYVHIIIYQLCLKTEIWFTSDHRHNRVCICCT